MNAHPGGLGTAATGARTDAPAQQAHVSPPVTAPFPPPAPSGRSRCTAAGPPGRVTITDLAAAKGRGEKWPMLTAYDALDRAGLRRRGHPGAAGRRLGRDGGVRPRHHDPGDRGRPDPADRGGGPRHQPRAGRGRPAVRLLPGLARGGTGHRRPVPEGGRRARGQARGRPAGAAPGRGTGQPRASRSWPTWGSPRSRSTRSVGTGCRAAARMASGCCTTPRRWRRRACSPSCSSACPRNWPPGSPRRCPSRPSASAPGRHCDAQVLVWQDMAGLSPRTPKFVKRYADVAGVLGQAARAFAEDVVGGAFPDTEHSYR